MINNNSIEKRLLISLPKLSKTGGVSSYWNAVLPELKKIPDIKIQEIEVGGHGKNILGPIKDQVEFNKRLSNKYDLVVLNPSLGLRSFFRDALFARKLFKNNIPFLIFFHGWNLEFENKVDKNYKRFFLKSFGKANTIIVLSEDFKNKIKDWGYDGKIIVETTTLDASLIQDFSFKNKIEKLYSSKKIKILFLARLEKEKGIFETIEAFKNISKRKENIELSIAGEGMAISEVENKVFNNDKIKVIGYVESKSKIDVFQDNHIYCLPSYSEGLPITVLEAMSFGMPVITTKVGGLKEFIIEGKMGFFVGVKNVKDLEDKLEFLIENKNKIIEIGQYNYEYANLKLLNNQVAVRMKSYFDNIISMKFE